MMLNKTVKITFIDGSESVGILQFAATFDMDFVFGGVKQRISRDWILCLTEL